MADICPLIQVRTADAAALQLRLHRLRVLSTAVLNEQLARPFPMQVGVPHVKKGDLSGAEIGTALNKLETQTISLRRLEARTPAQDVLLADLEARHRVACREAAEISAGAHAIGQLGRYSYRIATLEIRTDTETERYKCATIELIISPITIGPTCECIGLGGDGPHRLNVSWLPGLTVETADRLEGPWTVAAQTH